MRNKHTILAKGEDKVKKKSCATIALIAPNPAYRMKSYGPLSLLPLGSKCLLDVQIEAIKSVYKNFEIVLCCGFESNRVARYIKSNYKNSNIRIVENQLFESSSCCESLRLCLNNIVSDSLIICNGEILLYPELVKVYKDCPYILTQPYNKKSELELGCVVDDTNKVSNISFNLPKTWSEVSYLHNKEAIECFRRIISTDIFKNKMIFEALNEFSHSRFDLEHVELTHFANKIQNAKTYQKIKDRYENPSPQLFVRDNI